jgi:hypothetical protein
MQTFLPYPSLMASAMCLDRQRLGKQRLECAQILRSLESGRGWVSHPAVRMWRGYESALCLYHDWCIEEWTRRGYRNTMTLLSKPGLVGSPPWLGGPIHATHRAALLAKDPEWYGQYGWREEPVIAYHWPS